jgi:tripartite-type tricarboxylate transporter receptor subunit TctC
MKTFAACFAAATLCASPGAQGQTYPSKPVRMVVTFAAGGGADFVGRVLGQRLAETLGQPVVVDNRAGANGAIGNEFVAKAPPDGYTLLLGAAGPLTVSPALYTKLSFDTLRDFAPITVAASSPFTFALHPSVPARNLKEFIALAKAQPGKLNFGSSGTGGSPHLSGELLKAMAKIDVLHVPYKGLGPALTDLLGGQVDMVVADVSLVLPHARGGKLRALAVTSPERSSVMPDTPTVSEAAIPGYAAGTWYGLLAPAATPADILARLHGETLKILASPAMRERLATQGSEPGGNSPTQFAAFMRAEIDKWRALVKASNIKVE